MKSLFMCSAPENLFLNRRTHSDTSAELVEDRVGLTSSKLLLQLLHKL